jgi:putative transcriptional regulator
MANEKMKQSRLERQLSQAELARRVGVSRQTVNMIESGDYNPTLALCIRICRELGKTLDELFWEVEDHVQ